MKLPKYTAEKDPVTRTWVIYKDGVKTQHEAATSKEIAIHLKRLRKLAKAKAGLI